MISDTESLCEPEAICAVELLEDEMMEERLFRMAPACAKLWGKR